MGRKINMVIAIASAAALELMVDQTMSQPKCDFLKIAQEYIAQKFPSFDPAGLTPVISEEGNSWILSYELPEGMLGGAPIITIDKRTCTIIRVQHTQ